MKIEKQSGENSINSTTTTSKQFQKDFIEYLFEQYKLDNPKLPKIFVSDSEEKHFYFVAFKKIYTNNFFSLSLSNIKKGKIRDTTTKISKKVSFKAS